LWSILAFIVLLNLFLRRRNQFLTGDFFLIYVAQYSLIRFILEGIRVEVTYIPWTTINLSQALMAVTFIASVGIFLYRHRPGAVHKPVEQPTA
jgi:phosphatidylglycerol:prolipoprotein diacylglycerol transferase